jgi:hypothetical protein
MKLLGAASAPLIYMALASMAPGARADEPAGPPAWAGSEISLKHSFSVGSLMPDREPDYNPILVQSLSIDPAWRLTDRWKLVGHLGIETELTDSDVTTRQREPLLEDTTVTTTYRWPELAAWWSLQPSVSFRLTLPTSKESIARERLAGFSPGAKLARTFVPRAHVRVTPYVAARAAYSWQLSTSVVYDGPSITTCSAARGDACEEFDHSGIRSSEYTFTQIAGVDVELPHDVVLSASVWWIQSWLYDLTPLTGPAGEDVPSRDGATDWRFGNVYLLAADWQITGRWKASGGFQTESPQQEPDGDYYTPFFNRYTQVFVTAAAVF